MLFCIDILRGYIIKHTETHHINKANQSLSLITNPAELRSPRITFKKAQSSSELINLSRDHNLAPKSTIKRERLSLKCHSDKVQVNKGLTPTKISPYRHPSKDLYVIGITGTYGKSSVSNLIVDVLKSAGYKPFILDTLNSGNKELSTPKSADIETFMLDHLEQGGTHFIMEVTSDGIDQARILGIDFNIKLLTNITQDNLDYHKTFAKLQQTKLSFMREGNAHKIHPHDFKKQPIKFTTKLLGHFNLLNIKAAVSILRHINISESVIQKTLSSYSQAKGSLEFVDAG